MWQTKTSTKTASMTTTLGRIVTNLEGLLPIMLLDPLVTWFWEIKWQAKSIIFALLRCLWPPILVGLWLTIRRSHPSSYKNLWWRGLAKTLSKLKPSYLHYHSAYGHQTWQDGYLAWGTIIHIVPWLLKHVVFRDQFCHNFGRDMTYLQELLSI